MVMKIDRHEVRETLAGYGRANDVMDEERAEWLRNLTVEEAFRIYEDLCETAERFPLSADEAESLHQWRMETLLAMRRAFDAVARKRGVT
jgi:hypothetical protein